MKINRWSVLIECTSIATAVFLIIVSSPLLAQSFVYGCDEQALVDAKQSFSELRGKYIKDPSSVNEGEFRLAAFDYVELAERCYSATYSDDTGGQMIDEGGVMMGSNGILSEFDSSEYFLSGNKWGAGSPFTPGVDVPGPQIPGGIVTYSFMADGVVLDAEGSPLSNVAISSLATYSSCFLDEIELALSAWSAIADIQFIPVTDGGGDFNAEPNADIRIGAHTFDGPSGILAHAFWPPPNGVFAAGDTHFDSEEIWACTPGAGSVSLGLVALHEFGHAIGLRHETTDIAVMNPFYNPALTFGPLADDIMGAGEMYGTTGAATTTHFGSVGIGTDQPSEKLHVKDGDMLLEQTAAATSAILKFATAGSLWEIKQNGDTGRLTFFSPGGGAITASFKFDRQAQENLFRVGVLAADTVDINGKLVINGTDVTPDYVFDPDYELETIEEHAVRMWRERHLPALSSAAENDDSGVDVVRHQFGVLEELEKAHIYIEQLHNRVAELEAERDRLARLEADHAELRQFVMSQLRGQDSLMLTSNVMDD